MPKKLVQFAKPIEDAPDPIASNDKTRFRDLLLLPELKERTTRWRDGANWVRFLPRIAGTSYQWMMRVEVFQAPDGQGDRLPTFAHPKSFQEGVISPFDDAYAWFRQHAKEELYNREKNPNGLKLTTKSIGVAWLIHNSSDPGEKLQIFASSLYDGQWGGSPGLGYKVWMAANEIDTEPNSPNYEQRVHPDITAEEEGRLVLIEKIKPKSGEAKYASYNVRIGGTPAPVSKYTEALSDEEAELLRPLENVFQQVDEDQQHQILREYIGPKNYRSIFGEGEATGDPSVYKEPTNHRVEVEDETQNEVEEEVEEEVEDEATQVESVIEPEPESKPIKKASAPKNTESQTEEIPVGELMKMLNSKEGTETLLKEKFHLLGASHKDVCISMAKDYGLEIPEGLES